MEIGLGIHGEQGREQAAFPSEGSAKLVAGVLVNAVMEGGPFVAGDSVAVLVNNLGGSTAIEVYIVLSEVVKLLQSKGVGVSRIFVGAYMTALDMAGVSLSLLRLTPSLMPLIDAPTTAPHWVSYPAVGNVDLSSRTIPYDAKPTIVSGGGRSILARGVVEAVCQRLVAVEPMLTKYDQVCGDGDCGLVMKAGASRVLADLAAGTHFKGAIEDGVVVDGARFCSLLADSISGSMGGTSGGLLELMLRAMATHLATSSSASWEAALVKGVEAIQFYGGAKLGMRTMLDAFIPATEALQAGNSVEESLAAAKQGAGSTADMSSLAGRSNYLSADQIRGVPDPGAVAVAEGFSAAAEFLASTKR